MRTAPMDNPQEAGQGHQGLHYTLFSLCCCFMSWISEHISLLHVNLLGITPYSIDQLLKWLTQIAAIASGAMAVRHYYLQKPFFKSNK